jgi:calcineurin-like phosphoesterase family protein
MQRNNGNIQDLGSFKLTGDELVTSDTHLGHNNVIPYCNRPFFSADEMDEELIRIWNEVVAPDQIVFHLGDVAFRGSNFKKSIIPRLNGYKILVKGNHDAGRTKMVEFGFNEAYLQVEGELEDGRTFVMSHVPQPLLSKTADLYFCGHVHEKWCFIAPNIYNVGCDLWDFKPQTVRSVIEQAESRQKALLVQHTMETWFEPRDAQLSNAMYGSKIKGSLAE